MKYAPEEVNDPKWNSFVTVTKGSHFPIQNLPFSIFTSPEQPTPRCCSRIGDTIIDLSRLEAAGLFADTSLKGLTVFSESTLNPFIALGPSAWREARGRLSELLRNDNPELRDNEALRKKVFHTEQEAKMHLPITVTAYTDFYSSKEHACNLGRMFRGEKNALMPNWLHLPVGYDARAGSVCVSGTDFHRPRGQIKPAGAESPIFAASQKMDFEIETGFIVGKATKLGSPIPIENTKDAIFGMVLLNDWSSRDIQSWEYVPLGPFLGKSFCTSISPWILTLDALKPFQTKGPEQEPQPLPYLQNTYETFDIRLEAYIQSPEMSQRYKLATSNYKELYWNCYQQLAHHTVNGCNVSVGDLMGSGTISGATEQNLGSMIEITWNGTKPIEIGEGRTRTYLENGDTITLSGYCGDEHHGIGFGEVTGTVLPEI